MTFIIHWAVFDTLTPNTLTLSLWTVTDSVAVVSVRLSLRLSDTDSDSYPHPGPGPVLWYCLKFTYRWNVKPPVLRGLRNRRRHMPASLHINTISTASNYHIKTNGFGRRTASHLGLHSDKSHYFRGSYILWDITSACLRLAAVTRWSLAVQLLLRSVRTVNNITCQSGF